MIPLIYEVQITETLELTVEIVAASSEEAERLVELDWKNEKHVLGSEHFSGVSFRARKMGKS